ncbi:MAG: ABC-type transport auxiliary lipoprotein family protein [Sulfurimonadaceae bacterium]|jgi:cholesterol transport system auxiliary component|nr:ABC-type transport auxiliary lipoprotein family protein [Sulfurimonadaceae bacterium]
MMQYILAIVFVLGISGCSTTTPAVSEYRLKAKTQESKSMACKTTLKVHKVFTNAALSSRKIYYGEGQYKEFAYTQSQWSDALDRMLSDIITQSIIQREIYKSVASYKSQAKTDFVLEVNVEEFMQFYDELHTKSYAKVRLRATLLDTKNKKQKASQTFEAIYPVNTLNVEGGVIALDSALDELMQSMLVWLEGTCHD